MGLWQCPICTCHNDDNLLSCDICGVFRDSSSATENNDAKKGLLFTMLDILTLGCKYLIIDNVLFC